jgi:hypothetical protein
VSTFPIHIKYREVIICDDEKRLLCLIEDMDMDYPRVHRARQERVIVGMDGGVGDR